MIYEIRDLHSKQIVYLIEMVQDEKDVDCSSSDPEQILRDSEQMKRQTVRFFTADGQFEKVYSFYDGKLLSKASYLDGNMHADESPAYQEWNEKGEKISEKWAQHGREHNFYGPSSWNVASNSKSQCIWGVPVEAEDFLRFFENNIAE